MPEAEIPVVSVIVPARNEEACLALCLESLVSQAGIAFEIAVVDDASSDRTAEIARSFVVPSSANRERAAADIRSAGVAPQGRTSLAQDGSPGLNAPTSSSPGGTTDVSGKASGSRLTLVSAPPLPENWTGKNNAMSAGAKIAKGKWLLFTDADTVHKPGSLARAVTEAEANGAALLSYSPEQEVRTFLERAVMPVIFAELASTYPPAKVRDPNSPIAAANGQYLMISREAYDSVGGHTRIASDLLEDVAMAKLVKSSGHKVWFRYGADAVRTRMYRTWPQMKEGWTKNLALLFRRPVLRALLLIVFWMLSLVTFFLGLAAISSHHWTAAYCVVPLVFLYLRIARARFGTSANCAAIMLGVPVAAFLLIRSRVKRNRVSWKGRHYAAHS
jgi:glycosyltransferase involved in cell wall biosynthesis